MNVSALNKHERDMALIALIQEMHAMRSELNRLENVAQELKEVNDNETNSDMCRAS